MSRPIQVTVADQRGVNIGMLIRALEAAYLTPEGRNVRVKIGQGLHIDGVPEGLIRLVDAR